MPSREHLAQRSVLVVGDAMLDRYWFGSVDRISPEAPVPVVRVTREEERLGGAANAALNVRRLGVRATLMTVVGDDAAASALQCLLQNEGIEDRLSRDQKLRTIVKLRVIGQSQQLVRVDFENKPEMTLLNDMLARFRETLTQHDAVLFSDYGKGCLGLIQPMIQAARSCGKPVLVDPKGRDYQRYAGATVITPNRSELAHVIGPWDNEAELESQAQRLRSELQLDALLLTRSEEGMSLYDDAAHSLSVPTKAREVFDVTGAGDTVIATLACMLACEVPLRDATVIANRAAGIVVGKFGTAGISYEELTAAA